MPGPIICAKCGKALTLWEIDHGHKCREDLKPDVKRAGGDASGGTGQERRMGSEQEILRLRACPHCGQRSLSRNNDLYECLNSECRQTFTPEDLNAQETTQQTEFIRCKHCNQQFSTSDYETHLKLLARSARRGASCLKCGEPTYYFSHDGVWECLNPRCIATGVENAAIGDSQHDIHKEDEQKSTVKKASFNRPEPVPIEVCPNCSQNLHFDSELELFRCKNCHRIYTSWGLRAEKEKDAARLAQEQGKEKTEKADRLVVTLWVLIIVGVLLLIGSIAFYTVSNGWLQKKPSILQPITPTSTTPVPTLRPLPTPSPTPNVNIIPNPTPAPNPRLQELAQYMLTLINKDRTDIGFSPVILGNNSAAQKHAEDRLANNYMSHWGTDGMKPYMRYTLYGGRNYDAENVFITTTTRYGGREPLYRRDPKQMLYEAENSLMASPGHRRNILNKWHKKVNLGIAYSNDSLHLVQDFEGDYIEFNKIPTLSGNTLSMAGKLTQGSLYNIALYYDSLPQPLTPKQLLDGPRSYSLGDEVGYILPPPPLGYFYTKVPANSVVAKQWNVSPNGQFTIEADISPALQRGKGVYTVMIWAHINSESKDVTNYSIFVR